MVKGFKITLNQDSSQGWNQDHALNRTTYYPESNVNGVVHVATNKAKKYNGIEVSLIGEAHVCMTEERPYFDWDSIGCRTLFYSSNRNYIKKSIVLWKPSQMADARFPAGSHNFPFCFELKGNLPPTFDGIYGQIRYTIEAKITRSHQNKPERKISFEINVSHLLKIDTPSLLTSVQIQKQKTVGCTSAPVTLIVQLPRKGYCVGENIPLTATIQNGSGRRVMIRAKLLQRAKYKVQEYNKVSSTSKIVSNFATSSFIEQRSTQQWSPENLQIPSNCTQISIDNCDIITVSYALLVTVVIPWGINLKADVPVTIGNVPLQLI